MFSKFKIGALAGAVALALSGGAFANTSTSSGDANATIFLTVNDESTGAGFLYDTGLSVAQFTDTTKPASSFLNLNNDTSYQNFIASVGSNDLVTYSVLGGAPVIGSGSTATKTAYFTADTSNNPVAGVSGSKLNNAFAQFGTYLQQANFIASPGTSTEYSSGANGLTASVWFASGNEGSFSEDLQIVDGAALGTPLAFYTETTSTPNKAIGFSAVTQLQGQWDLANGQLSYTVAGASPVPLPAAVWLLGSGLMGLVGIGRRRKAQSAASFEGAAA